MSRATRNGVVRGKDEPLPVNAPTGGWGVLNEAEAFPATLLGFAQHHFWVKVPTR